MEQMLRSEGLAVRPTGERQRSFQRVVLLWMSALLLVLFGCSRKGDLTSQQRAEAAKALFERTTKTFHIPSAEAKDAEKEKLQKQAATGYEELLKSYPEQDYWAAQALRSL